MPILAPSARTRCWYPGELMAEHAPSRQGSLRQPGFAQAVFVSGEIFRTTERETVLHTGNPESRIQLGKARGNLLRFLDPADERIACCGDAVPGHVAALH